jgi:2-polyprenyl-6-methoxyphenol hydroxylase-like FAD-dependent oxidoreductase
VGANKQSDILIVGAGPTGLTLACNLAQRGVSFRIIDAASQSPAGSRGKGLQPRSLELFDDLGIVERVIANGSFDIGLRHYDETGKYSDDQRTGIGRSDVPYGTTLITPQWRVEAALRQQLESLGGRVEYGRSLEQLSQDDQAVSAQLKSDDGTSTQIRIRWLVGCDGGKSTVRHLAGISFLGETIETYRMMLADVHVSGIDREHWHIWRSAEGFLALCPLPSTEEYQFQASIAPGQPDEPSLQALQDIAARRAHDPSIRISDPGWMSMWRANVRMVDRYRAGRVMLAGDAAHVHSPAGGQGMNTGIQDAYNLGWKLAAVLHGASASLLDTYQEERLPVAAGVLGLSNELMASVVAAGTLTFRRNERTSQLGLNYRASSLSRETRSNAVGLQAGDRAPDAPGLAGPNGTRRLFDLLRGPEVKLLGFGARWQPLIDECVRRFGPAVRGCVVVDQPGHVAHYVDQQGHARAAYADDTLFVIRPDNYVGMATASVDTPALLDYLQPIAPRAA